MNKVLTSFLAAIIQALPDAIICEIQDIGLVELDRRGLIIWADTTENKVCKE